MEKSTASTTPSSPTTTPVDPTASVPISLAESTHDVLHQVGLVREAMQSEKRRLGFFLGAGCPLGIFDKDDKASVKHIPDVAGLTAVIAAELAKEPEFKTPWEKLSTACKEAIPTPNVEHILTQLRTICALKGSSSVDGLTADGLKKLDARICRLIADTVGKALPKHANSYHRFAAWISQIDRVHPVEIFTPNYDLLFEEAFEQYKVPFFDGFVGAREPFFDLAAMEHDAVPPRWTRLWKLHGSINWARRGDDSFFRRYPVEKDLQLLIYPSHLKYEQSRRMPYLAMIDRLRAFFRDNNPVLVLCGYSFADDHLNEVLLDGLRGNRSAHCFALMYPALKDCETAVAHATKHANLSVLAWDGAVIGTRSSSYKAVEPPSVARGSGYDAAKVNGTAGERRLGAGQCRLGDFHHFTLFLETQFGVKILDQQTA